MNASPTFSAGKICVIEIARKYWFEKSVNCCRRESGRNVAHVYFYVFTIFFE